MKVKFDQKAYIKYRNYRLSQPKPNNMDVHYFQGNAFSHILNGLSGYEYAYNRNDMKEANWRMEKVQNVLNKLGDSDAIETYKMLIFKGE